MEIRPAADEDRDVFLDTVHVAFGGFRDIPAEDGGGVFWAALEWTATCSP